MKQGKKVSALEFIWCILDFRVSYGDLSWSYQECAQLADLRGPLTLCKVEGVGFEPTQPVRAADLQSAPINHSGTPPSHNSIKKCLKNLAREGSRTHQPTDYKSVALPLSYSGDF
jgi:hypothetical protein